ncbi:helix-turn-helix domain-containing protein [Actinoplanes sp. CA-252034]|uniref:helix-turn-helix domain-containing protein n=1 Tax=Actinoplanes sp. CA-252034 TaxID=3239906 RepID=UPI003D97F780
MIQLALANPENIGPALTDLRTLHKLTKRQVAAAADMGEPQYGQYELGRKIPTVPILLRILAVYGSSFAILPGEEA